MDFMAFCVLLALGLAVLAAVFMARAATQHSGAAVAWGLWILAVFVVPFVFFFVLYAMYPYLGEGVIGAAFLTVFLAMANAVLYWVAYAIFRTVRQVNPMQDE